MWPLVLHVCCAVRSRRQESGQEAATFLPFIHSICPPLKVPAAERKLFASGGLVEDSGACSHTIPPAAQFSTTFSSVLSIPFSYHPNDVVHLYSERQARILVLRTNQPTNQNTAEKKGQRKMHTRIWPQPLGGNRKPARVLPPPMLEQLMKAMCIPQQNLVSCETAKHTLKKIKLGAPYCSSMLRTWVPIRDFLI